ncbi:MAG: hypothetical protein HGA36_03685 [Candidatus Moranbacteria bacterium]|nr:hypothetical protein [Candidatus Moranbacteria bacterium]
MKSEILNAVFILCMGILSFFVIREDIKHKKIKNKFVLFGFLAGSMLFLLGFLLGFVQPEYLRSVFLNSLVALVVAYIFWLTSFWPAGDAKLFVLFSFLLPLHYYWKSYLPIFPSLILLVNIFVCAYVFLLVQGIVHLGWLIRKKDKSLPGLISSGNALFSPKVLISFFKKINLKVLGRSVLMIIGMFCFSYYVFDLKHVGVYSLIKTSIVTSMIWLVSLWIIRKYIIDNETYVIAIEELFPGALIAVKQEDHDVFSSELLKKIGPMRADGVDARQVAIILEDSKARGIKSIALHENIPFSPLIVVGGLVTVILSDNVVQLIKNMFT